MVNGHTYGLNAGKTYADVNAYTGGWDALNTSRVFVVNGQYDPWRDATYASDFRPEGKLHSTSSAKAAVIPGAFHCTDLISENGVVNNGTLHVQNQQIKQVGKWVDEYYVKYGRSTS